MQFQKSSDAKILETVLSECAVGQMITYEELSKAIGRDVRVHAAGALATARKTMLKEKNMVFATERSVGIKRLDDSDIIDSTADKNKRIARISKRGLQELSVVKFEQLDEQKKKEHIAASAQLGVIAMFSKTTSGNKILSNVKNDTKVLAIGDTIKMFS
jgi:hypothetical protein